MTESDKEVEFFWVGIKRVRKKDERVGERVEGVLSDS